MTEAPDTSRISFTALYTGQVWQRHGLGDPALDTWAGSLLYGAVAPFNLLGGWLRRGLDLETMLLHRHKLIDHLLDAAIHESGVRQIVEVAAGMSPRGIRYRRRYRDLGLLYVEADLPGMAGRKRVRLARGGYLDERHRVVECNALATSGPQSLVELFRAQLDPTQPTAIVTEGLVNYFSVEELQVMWSGFRAALATTPFGVYVSDIALDLGDDPYASVVRAAKLVLEAMTRGRTHLHFADAEACRAALARAGFTASEIFNPKEFTESLELPPVAGDSLVRVLRATVA